MPLHSDVGYLVTHTQRSERRHFVASALIILSAIGLFAVLLQVTSAIVLPPHRLTLRVLWVALAACLLLFGACVALKDSSLLWQVPLQSFAAAAVTLGAGLILMTAFNDWHLLMGALGLRALASLTIGIGAGRLMRRLQVRKNQ